MTKNPRLRRQVIFILPFLGLCLITISCLSMFRMDSGEAKYYYNYEYLNSAMTNCPSPKRVSELNKYADFAEERQIKQNEADMWNQNFTSEEYGALEAFFNEPERTKVAMIFATWRSGSTFLGELLQSHPAVYYHFEPLMYLQSTQVKNKTLERVTLPLVENLINCNYTANHNLEIFKEFNQTQFWMHYHNRRLFEYCSCDYSLCGNSPFLERICGTFPFQVMKLVRLRLRYADRFLKDERNEVKVVHLVRDPRAVWVSRQPHGWCRINLDCWDPKRMCNDMVDDFYAYEELKKKYPGKIFFIRFEELSLTPEVEARNLVKKLGLSFHPFVREFIRSHTEKNEGNYFATFRNSSSVVFAWKSFYEGKPEELQRVENDCVEALDLWGYLKNSSEILGQPKFHVARTSKRSTSFSGI